MVKAELVTNGLEKTVKVKKPRKQKDPQKLIKEYVINQLFAPEKKIRKSSAWIEAAKKYKTEKNISYKQALKDLKKK